MLIWGRGEGALCVQRERAAPTREFDITPYVITAVATASAHALPLKGDTNGALGPPFVANAFAGWVMLAAPRVPR